MEPFRAKKVMFISPQRTHQVPCWAKKSSKTQKGLFFDTLIGAKMIRINPNSSHQSPLTVFLSPDPPDECLMGASYHCLVGLRHEIAHLFVYRTHQYYIYYNSPTLLFMQQPINLVYKTTRHEIAHLFVYRTRQYI